MSSSNEFQIVIGLDGAAPSLAAFQWAVDEARMRHGRVRMVTGWQYPSTGLGMNGLTWDLEEFEQDARKIQEEALESIDSDGLIVEAEIRYGPPATALLDASKEADLVIVGSRGRGGFTGLLLGSVSSQIVQHAPCPVLVVRG